MNFAEQNLTGKASIDKPWLNFYPEEFRNLDLIYRELLWNHF